MPQIFHQTVEDILNAADPEQKLIWNQVFLMFGERAPISQYYYCGIWSAAEFATYSANRIYLSYCMNASAQYDGAPGSHYMTFYNQNNVLDYVQFFSVSFWDATAAAVRFTAGNTMIKNKIHSRLEISNMNSYINWIGYRIGR